MKLRKHFWMEYDPNSGGLIGNCWATRKEAVETFNHWKKCGWINLSSKVVKVIMEEEVNKDV